MVRRPAPVVAGSTSSGPVPPARGVAEVRRGLGVAGRVGDALRGTEISRSRRAADALRASGATGTRSAGRLSGP